MDNPFSMELSYSNIFKCGNNILNKLDATCKRAWIATSRDKYYAKIYETLIDFNDRNDGPFSNKNICDAMHKVIEEEEWDSHNIISYFHIVTVDTFNQTSNKQRENGNAVLTSEKARYIGHTVRNVKRVDNQQCWILLFRLREREWQKMKSS